MSHLLTMYGFVIFVVTTATMIFSYPTPAEAAPGMLVALWHIGALMVCVGGYWFWFFIRCDVNSEGKPWYRLVRADLFILSLLMTTTFALFWSITRGAGALNLLFFVIFIVASTTPVYAPCCGQNLRTCSSSRRPHTRRKSPGQMVRKRICLIWAS